MNKYSRDSPLTNYPRDIAYLQIIPRPSKDHFLLLCRLLRRHFLLVLDG